MCCFTRLSEIGDVRFKLECSPRPGGGGRSGDACSGGVSGAGAVLGVTPNNAPSQGCDPLLPPLASSLRGDTGEMLHMHVTAWSGSVMAPSLLQCVQIPEVLHNACADAS